MDDYCTVTFTGDQGGTYYVACNLVEYIDDVSMVNTGSSTINLYSSPQQGTNTASITIPAFSYPRYGSGTNYRYITNARDISFNNHAYFIREFDLVEIVLLSFMVTFHLIRLLTGGRR